MKNCKECVYFNTYGTTNFHGFCDLLKFLTDADYTCGKFKKESEG